GLSELRNNPRLQLRASLRAECRDARRSAPVGLRHETTPAAPDLVVGARSGPPVRTGRRGAGAATAATCPERVATVTAGGGGSRLRRANRDGQDAARAGRG